MQFDLNSFQCLNLLPAFGNKYNPVGTEQFEAAEAIVTDCGLDSSEYMDGYIGLLDFVAKLGEPISGNGEVDFNELLMVVAGEAGEITQLYGPAIFNDGADEPKLVLKVGKNLYRVTESEEGLAVGALKAQPQEVVKGEGDNQYSILLVKLRAKGSKDVFEVPIMRPKDSTLNQGECLAILENGSSIAEYVKPIPEGGLDIMKLNDVPEGEYRILDLKENKPHAEYGRSWFIKCVNSNGEHFAFNSKGSKLVNTLTKMGKIYETMLAKNKPLTFEVISKEQLNQGVAINCAIWLREPGIIAQLPQLTATAAKAIAPAKNSGGVAVLEATAVEIDELPF